MTPQPLSYATPQPRPRELTLDERPDGFALTFALPPRRLTSGLTVFVFSLAAFITIVYTRVLWLSYQVYSTPAGLTLPPDEIRTMWYWIVGIMLFNLASFWGMGIYFFLDDRKWGHVPRIVSVENGRLIWQRRGFWGIRIREWPLEQVKEVNLKPVNPLFGSKTVADVIIRFHNRRLPFHLRLSTRDPDLPRRVEMLLNHAIGQPTS